ncbi:hypothetical protein SANA_23160 [Gottschalkiaceae bacterium SANA]|nr:hypothetical protein SANA_23160 [Gottschalkiaceae bacterium SANA]
MSNQAPRLITIKKAADIMGKSEMFVRIGLRRGLLPFGVAWKMPGSSSFSYYIYPNKFQEFVGGLDGEIGEGAGDIIFESDPA